ncbi:DUF1758 domain-containing protein [Trichonephila clavipes]|nr:DUF1758 domain-containing protein [Trichonephila clavipes]
MAPKQSKNIGKFDLIIKELKAFGSRINECDDNKSRIRVLKTQVLQYETRLTEIFSELSTQESDESFDIYMKYKDILFNWVVDLEEKSQVEEVNSSIHEARGLNELKFVKPDIKKGNVKPLNSFNKSNVNTTVVKCNQVKSGVKPDVVKGNNCILCYQSHALFKCPTFNSMNVNERWQVVQNNNLCTNCLRSNHRLDTCRIGFSCKNCSERHHTLLHIYSVSPSADTQANSVVTVSNNCTQSAEGHVLLSTALINVKSKHGEQIKCRALIDNASQNSLISKQCADRLKLPLKHTNHKLVGVNETFAETSLYSTNFEFSSCVSSDKFQVKALLVSKVTSAMPNFPIKYHEWPHIKDLTLADPTFYIENEIDILLGADVFMTLISGTPIMGPKGTPSALPTKLGHLLSGTINTQYNQNSSLICHTLLNIDHSLKQFWELESVPKDIPSKDEDELCESIFVNSHIRNADGRYILKLPFRDDSSIGDSKEGALKRFYSLERKLHSNNQLKEQYTEFMEEYQNLGHMTPLASDVKSPHYFLPHHGVINDNSSTTKLRVVFDGSFKSTNGNSLNDILLTGKKLQSDIFLTLLKFRFFPIAFSADIAKMYRQILISKDDACFQQIFWRKSPEEPLVIFKLNTVTYGTSCAPFLAIRTLKQLCEDENIAFHRQLSSQKIISMLKIC